MGARNARAGAIDRAGSAAAAETTHSALREPDVSIIVPTRNEAANVRPLVERITGALDGLAVEVVFVDDSDDETAATVESVIRSARDPRAPEIVLLHRPAPERVGGLGGAVLQGIRAARAPWVCVMDGDLQHPPELVPELLAKAESDGASLVVATRYRDGGGADGLHGRRGLLSRASTGAAKAAFPLALRDISDPMSGFFLVERRALELDRLDPDGFKILVEIAVRTRGLRVAEVSYQFGDRIAGESKASLREGATYLKRLAELRVASPKRKGARHPRSERHVYDVHGIVTIESDGRLPELEPFRVASLTRPASIRVRLGRVPAVASTKPEPFRRRIRYSEAFGSLGFATEIEIADRVEVLASPVLRYSPHVLYTNIVEPILRWTFVSKGYALVHGACIVDGDDAFMITARTDTGKTTTMLKLLDAHPFGFVADDLTIVCPDGRVLPYPKPLTISKHTLHAVKRPLLTPRERSTLGLQSRLHSRSGRRFAFILTRTGLPVATVNTLVQLMVPPPKYAVERLVPGVRRASDARLAALFVIQRDDQGFEWLEEDDALEILLRNCEDAYGFPPYHAIEDFLLDGGSAGLRETERQIIAGALEGRPAALLSSRDLDWATRIPNLIDDIRTERPAPIPITSQRHGRHAGDNGNGVEHADGNGAPRASGHGNGVAPAHGNGHAASHPDGNGHGDGRRVASNAVPAGRAIPVRGAEPT